MPFEVSQLSPPFNTPARFIEFHWPGGLCVWMGVQPLNTVEPREWPDPPYYDRHIYGSADQGKSWTEVTTYPFVAPLDSGVDRVWDSVYCGNSKVVGRALDSSGSGTDFLRLESNDAGVTWTMAPEASNIPLSGDTNDYLDNSQYLMTYAGGGEIYTLRPAERVTDGNMLRANVYKSTDYGVTYTNIGIIQAWNCRGICYMGTWDTPGPLFGKKRFICMGGRDVDGVFDGDEDHQGHYSAVMRSDDGGVSWGMVSQVSTDYNATHGQSGNGWWNKSRFVYMGDGVVLLMHDGRASSDITTDAIVYKSENYGDTWTEIYRIPKSPQLIPILGDPVPETQATDQHVQGLWYLGKRKVGGTHPDAEPVYKEYVYAIVATSFVTSLVANAYNLWDGWLSDDGGETWTNYYTIPYIWDGGSPGVPDIQQIWWPECGFYALDNEAIPGLYD